MDFMQSLSGNAVFMIFLTLVLGYALGRISFAGIEFGTSGVLIVALIFVCHRNGGARSLSCLCRSLGGAYLFLELKGKFLGLHRDDGSGAGGRKPHGYPGGEGIRSAP